MSCKCTGKTLGDCLDCGVFFSSHSLHYCRVEKMKVSTVSCQIGGNKKFNEQGDEV
jgi:hypothetical protein